jgi:hypothetical protein
MTRKTESLSYPKNPLAAMRELQELDAQVHIANGNDPAEDSPAVALATTLPTSSAVALANSSDVGSTNSSAVASADSSDESSATSSVPQTRKRKQGARTKAEDSEDESLETGNPLAKAVRDMLSQPYTADPKRGPFTVSTVKIPTEISERLGWVSALTGKAKQEILADALKDYFTKVLKEG